MSEADKRYAAGDAVDDTCRVCKMLRAHTVMSADSDGRILRVVCDYCTSHHNYRGGGEPAKRGTPAATRDRPGAWPLVSERERRYPPVNLEGSSGSGLDVEELMRRVLREELGLSPVVPADKWRGGELVLKPGRPGVQEKSWPIETFFQKVVMLRNRLRMLEQQVNAAELPTELKLKLQSYVTGCYGSLTSFNVLFADDGDRFKGSGKG